MTVSVVDGTGQAAVLRAAMVDDLRELGPIRTERIADAFGVVPRHVFAPGESLERAYAPTQILVAKRDERGVAVSMVSAAHIQAMMLEQARIEPGMRVLEIGSGGYNAALIAELVGATGGSPRSTSTRTLLTAPGAASWRRGTTGSTWCWRTRRAVCPSTLPTTV